MKSGATAQPYTLSCRWELGRQKIIQRVELQGTGKNYKNWLHVQCSSGRAGLVECLVTAERRFYFFLECLHTPPVPAFVPGSSLLKFLKRKAGQGCPAEEGFLSDAPRSNLKHTHMQIPVSSELHGGLHKQHSALRLLLPTSPSYAATANKWQTARSWKKGNRTWPPSAAKQPGRRVEALPQRLGWA